MDQPEDTQKQQNKERVLQKRFQSTSISKDLTTDDLIKNILEKVDTEAKISKFYSAQNRNTQTPKVSTTNNVNESLNSHASHLAQLLPIPQCFLVSSDIPSVYHEMWNLVKSDQCGEFCDRDKLYRALLLSNLSSAVLAQLWSYVNRTVPGQLTKAELFVMLALIGLLQQSSHDPVNDLYTATTIPTPFFTQLFSTQPHSTSTSSTSLLTNTPVELAPKLVEDEFCEFKSASFDYTSQVKQFAQNKEEPKQKIVKDDTNLSYLESSRELRNSTERDMFQEEPKFECNFSLTLDDEINLCDVPSDPVECFSNELKLEDNLNSTNMVSAEDKYSSLRGLGIDSAKEGNDEFGDFLSHPHDLASSRLNSTKTSPIEESNNGRMSNKRKLLTSCKQAMLKTFNTLVVNHGEESVLEALRSKDGTNFAFDLYEVFKISSRIKANIEMSNDSNETEACRVLLEEIHRKWNYIYNTFKKASIEVSMQRTRFTDSNGYALQLADECSASMDQVTVGRCAICSDTCFESSTLLFTSFRYHNSCANFWLNSVSSSLPGFEN